MTSMVWVGLPANELSDLLFFVRMLLEWHTGKWLGHADLELARRRWSHDTRHVVGWMWIIRLCGGC